jgi:hypothetical protein
VEIESQQDIQKALEWKEFIFGGRKKKVGRAWKKAIKWLAT